MKAVVYRNKTGLTLEDIPAPEVDEDSVIVKVINTGFCGSVCMISIIFKSIAITQPLNMNFKEIRFTGSYSNTHEENKICLQWMAEGKIDARLLISDLITLDELPGVYRERIQTGKALKVMLAIGDEF